MDIFKINIYNSMAMKKMIFIFFLIPLISFAQNEKNNTREVADSIVFYFNSENTSKIFSMFSNYLKKEVPENEVSDFLEGLKTSRGKITKIELNFEKMDKVFQVILKSFTYEILYKPNVSINIIIKEYLDASNFFIELSQTKYLNALIDKLAKKLRS